MTWFLALLGFSRLKFFLIAGGIAAALAIVSGAYVKGRLDCNAAVQLQKLRDENRILRKSIKFLEEDGKSADRDSKADAEFEKKVKDIEDQIADGACFTRDESERLRKLWRSTTGS